MLSVKYEAVALRWAGKEHVAKDKRPAETCPFFLHGLTEIIPIKASCLAQAGFLLPAQCNGKEAPTGVV